MTQSLGKWCAAALLGSLSMACGGHGASDPVEPAGSGAPRSSGGEASGYDTPTSAGGSGGYDTSTSNGGAGGYDAPPSIAGTSGTTWSDPGSGGITGSPVPNGGDPNPASGDGVAPSPCDGAVPFPTADFASLGPFPTTRDPNVGPFAAYDVIRPVVLGELGRKHPIVHWANGTVSTVDACLCSSTLPRMASSSLRVTRARKPEEASRSRRAPIGSRLSMPTRRARTLACWT
jgi:hypothetical protein